MKLKELFSKIGKHISDDLRKNVTTVSPFDPEVEREWCRKKIEEIIGNVADIAQKEMTEKITLLWKLLNLFDEIEKETARKWSCYSMFLAAIVWFIKDNKMADFLSTYCRDYGFDTSLISEKEFKVFPAGSFSSDFEDRLKDIFINMLKSKNLKQNLLREAGQDGESGQIIKAPGDELKITGHKKREKGVCVGPVYFDDEMQEKKISNWKHEDDSIEWSFALLTTLISEQDIAKAKEEITKRLLPNSCMKNPLKDQLRKGYFSGQVRLVKSYGKVQRTRNGKILAVEVEWFCENILPKISP